MPACQYPIGGELSLSTCIAASHVLSRYSYPLEVQGHASVLEQVTWTIQTHLDDMRQEHGPGSDPQPFADRLKTALMAIGSIVPGTVAARLADDIAAKVTVAVFHHALDPPGPAENCCEFALSVTSDSYARHGAHVTRNVIPAIKPATSDPEWHEIPGKVAGTTTLRRALGEAEVEVVLNITPPWDDAVDNVLYVLFHEYVAHAFRGPSNSAQDTGPGSEFAEGWMDWVALLVFTRAASSGSTPAIPWPWDTVDITQRMDSIHMTRRRGGPWGKYGARWRAGIKAAQVLETVIRGTLEADGERAQDEVVRLSLLLNASEETPARRDKLAKRLYMLGSGDDTVQDDVGAWLQDGLPPERLFVVPFGDEEGYHPSIVE